jgi:cytochrome c biogenesis protein CcmG/thiol:disulfide interchange protein DsbE
MTTQTARRSLAPFWIVAGVGIVVVALGVIFSSRFGSDPTLTASPLIGQPAPETTVPLLDGDGEFDMADLDGDVAVVNFWASWCFNCRVEHDVLGEAAARYEDLGVRFVGAMVQDSPGNGLAFLDELGRSPETTYLDDDRSRLSLEFGLLGVPETFFIDRDGTIVAKVSGPVDAALLTGTLDAILLGRADDLGAVVTGEVENR